MTTQVSRTGRWLLLAMLVLVAAATPAAAVGDGNVRGSSYLDAGGASGVGPASVATTRFAAFEPGGTPGDPGPDLVPDHPAQCSAVDPTEWRACAEDSTSPVEGRSKPRLVRAADLQPAVPGVGDYHGIPQVRTVDPGSGTTIGDANGVPLTDVQRSPAPADPVDHADEGSFVTVLSEFLRSTTGSSVPVTLPGVAVGAILGAVVVLSARYPGRRFTDSIGELVPGIPAGNVPDDGPFAAATGVSSTPAVANGGGSVTAPSTDTAPARCDGDGSTDGDADLPADDLVPDEKVVERLLESNGGRMKQGTIVDETSWSKSKVSRLLSRMTEDDTIVKVKLGRENLICLDGSEPEIVSDPVPNRERTGPGAPVAGGPE